MATFYLKRGDTLPVLSVALKGTDGLAFNLTGYAVELHIALQSGTQLSRNMTVSNAAGGLVEYAWVAGDWAAGQLVPGFHRMEYEATLGAAVVTFPNNSDDELVVVGDLG